MEEKILTPRLQAVAELVPEGTRLVDIGTDHAYLPIALLQNGKIASAIAADLRKGPLTRAKANLKAHHMEDRVETILSNGFSAIEPSAFDTAVIAGMGGETIAEILSAAPFLKKPDYLLVLQPQSKAELLREYLAQNGFEILHERLALEEEKLYHIFSVKFTDKKAELPLIRTYISEAMEKEKPTYYPLYLDKLIARMAGVREGLLQATALDEKRMEKQNNLLKELKKYREECS